ncbi:unnamed protein product [Cunninghamella echinulata]
MFQRLIILEADHHSLWIKVVGIFLIIVRFVDLPFELAMYQITNRENHTTLLGDSCWATWQTSVLILNFIGDALANTFLSGMFIKRLYKHINTTRASTPQNQMIEYIARKSLICLILTFFVNLIMNLFKITSFLGSYSDAFTVYFELIESTLLVEALRVDENLRANVGCSHCGKSSGNHNSNNKKHSPPSQKRSILQTFNSFDFVPLEERPSLSDSFQKSNNGHHQRYSVSSNSPANGGGRRRYPSIMDYSPSELYRNNLDDIIEMNPALSDDNNNNNTNNKDNNNNSDNEKRAIDHKTTIHTTSSNDLPASYTSSHSLSSTSPSTTAILSSSPSIPAPLAHQQHHYQQQQQQLNNNSTGPLETLSSSLVHHPDWNNNHHDYKPF